MTDPRSIAFASDRWLTHSRVYNLIWLGRWLERADSLCRAINLAAVKARENNDSIERFQEVLVLAAQARGIPVGDPKMALSVLIKDRDASSVYHCLNVARNNATQVGPLELVRSMGETLYQIESFDTVPDTVPGAHVLISGVLAGLESVYKVIEDTWFTGEPLSEEEVYKRFVQQQ